MVGCAAGLDPDHRRCKRLEEGHHLFAPQHMPRRLTVSSRMRRCSGRMSGVMWN
jgi:hypothetical protein